MAKDEYSPRYKTPVRPSRDVGSPRFIRMQMKLVQLSSQSIENLMTRPESLPLSLNDLLAAIPLDWREQSLGLSTKSA